MMAIDGIIIIIICFCSASGFKKGMLVSLFSIFAFFISLYLTYLLLPYFLNLIYDILDIKDVVSNDIVNNNITDFFMNNNSKLVNVIKFLLHINDYDLKLTVTQLIVNVLSFLILSIIVKVIIKFLLKKCAGFMKNFFIIGSFDKMCGLCFGFMKGIIFVGILCFVITSLNGFGQFNNILGSQISESVLLETFNEGTNYIISSVSSMFQ